MKQTESRAFTQYLPVHSTATTEPTKGFPIVNNLRVTVSYSNKRYSLAVSPVEARDNGLVSCILSSMQFARLEDSPRFNAKTLAQFASIVHRCIDSRDLDSATMQLVNKVLADNSLALTTPSTGKSRQEIIDGCVASARKPCPEIRERFTLLCSDGNYYGAFGIPLNVTVIEPMQRKSEGFAFVSPDGTTYGTRETLESDLRNRWEESQDRSATDFRNALEAMSDERLEAQAIYWFAHGYAKAA